LNEFLWVMALLGWAAVAGVCGMSSTVILWKMVDEVNVQLPEAERFSPLGWHPFKFARLIEQYRYLCPSGKRITQLRSVWWLVIVWMVIGTLAAGFGVAGAAWIAIGGCATDWLWFRSRLAAGVHDKAR
jgi:hypothetical protein